MELETLDSLYKVYQAIQDPRVQKLYTETVKPFVVKTLPRMSIGARTWWQEQTTAAKLGNQQITRKEAANLGFSQAKLDKYYGPVPGKVPVIQPQQQPRKLPSGAWAKKVPVIQQIPKAMANRRRAGKGGAMVTTQGVPAAYTSLPLMRKQRIQQINGPNGGNRISGSEYLFDLTGETTFTVVQNCIYPGADMMSLLKQHAHLWEQYRVNQISFTYVPSAAVTTTAGNIIMAVSYDLLDTIPETVGDISVLQTSVPGRPYQAFTVNAIPKMIHKFSDHKKNRMGPPRNGESDLYDICQLFVSVDDAASQALWGKVWVSYDISFFSQTLDMTQSPSVATLLTRPSNFYWSTLNSAQTISTGTQVAVNWDAVDYNGMSDFLFTETSGEILLPRGIFVVNARVSFWDDTSESMHCEMHLRHNNTPISGTQTEARSAGGTNEIVPLTTMGIITSSGTSTLKVQVECTASAGVLKLSADAQLIIHCI